MISTTGIERLHSTVANGPVVMFATPAYAGIDPRHAKSLLESAAEFAKRGYRTKHFFTTGQSLAANARAELFGHFLADPEAEWMLMADSDVGWERDLPLRLMSCDKPVVGVVVPEVNDFFPGQPLRWDFEHRRTWTDPLNPAHVVHDRYGQTPHLGVNLVLVQKNAAKALAERYAHLAIRVGDTKTFAVFHPHHEEDQTLPEDAAFFLRCAESGVPAWASGTARVSRTKRITVEREFLRC